MAYREPRLRVQQSFEAAPASSVEPLHALIMGTKYALHRYGIEDNSPIGAYSKVSGNFAEWPNHVPGATVDLATARLIDTNALVQYCPYIGSAISSPRAKLTATNGNKLRSSPTGDGGDNLVFKANGVNYPRSGVFGDRDVQVGDIVDLVWSGGSLRSRVAALEADRTVGASGTPARSVGVGSTVAGATPVGTPASRLAISYDYSAYNGLVTGYPSDEYSVTVVQIFLTSGSYGPFEGTRLQVLSDSGDTNEIVLGSGNWSAVNERYEVDLGTRGAVMYIADQNYIIADEGTAQAGAATEITLQAGASAVDEYYTGMTVVILSGTGADQSKVITAYNGTTKVATVSAWSVNPDNTSVYEVRGASIEGQTQAGSTINTIVLAADTYGADDFCLGDTIYLAATGQLRKIVSYDSGTQVATVDRYWDVVPGTAVDYAITPTAPVNADTWGVVISQDYTEADVTDNAQFVFESVDADGYTGAKDTQYQVRVIRGGRIGTDSMQVRVGTNNGSDTETVINIPAGVTGSAVYPVGTRNMQVEFFENIEFNAGDVIVIDCTAATATWYRTLVLANTLDKVASVTEDIYITLYVTQDVVVPEGFQTLTADDITVAPNMEISSTLLGSALTMYVQEGILYADYREQNPIGANTIFAVATQAECLSLCGTADPLNPLGYAAALALAESQGVSVYCVILEDDTEASYAAALDVMTDNDTLYGIVPLTNDESIKGIVKDHVLERSSDINNQWRVAWFSNPTQPEKQIYSEDADGDDLIATEITVYGAPSSSIRKVYTPNAIFNASGTVVGDYLRLNFRPDGTYDEYIITEVGSNYVLVDASDLAPTVVSTKVETWRHLTNSQYAAELAAYPAKYNERRVRSVWVDNPVDPGTGDTVEMYYMCAVLAGQRSGVAPHAPMSRMTISALTMDPVYKFGRDDLNTIAAGGNWIVTKDFNGNTFTRHQITSVTNPDDLDKREDSKTTNLDSISREMVGGTDDLWGRGNISSSMLSILSTRIQGIIDTIKNREWPAILGPQMLNAEILKLERDPVLRDSVLVEINPDMPDPLNDLTIRFRVGAAANQ